MTSASSRCRVISRTPSLLPLDLTFKNYVTAWTREAAPGQTDFPHGLMTSVMSMTAAVNVGSGALSIAYAAGPHGFN